MSRHDSQSIALELDTRSRRRENEEPSSNRQEGRLRGDRPRRQDRDRSSHDSQERNGRKERHSISPGSEHDYKHDKGSRRRHERRKYRERSSYRSRSGSESESRRRRKRRRSRSPSRTRTRSPSRSRSPTKPATTALQRSHGPLPSQNQAFSRDKQSSLKPSSGNTTPNALEKQKPNFNVTGKLAAASNTVQTAGQTIVLKYHEPAEARKPPPRDAWRMYVFKDDEIVDTVQLWEQSCWLLGRELAVADIPMEHPSCSGQHAVVQFRYVEKRNEFGDKIGRVKPYVLDLESAHGTCLNEEWIEEGRYFELRDGDVLKFGRSRREYVVQLPKKD